MNKHRPSILVIDDSKLNRAVISKILSELEMTITEAVDGRDGLEKFSQKNYDLVLVDLIMPNMDGISFLKAVREKRSSMFIPIILMTGNEDLETKISGLNIGADDFLTKPVNQKELVARVYSLLRSKRAHDQLLDKNTLIKEEMLAAKKIQQFILPDTFEISHPKVYGLYHPLEEIGGDFYDCLELNENMTGFLICDVTGHGIPAALVVTMAKMIFSIYAPRLISPKKVFKEINNRFMELLLEDQYLTSFYVVYDKITQKIHFSNAGHVQPLLYKASKKKVYKIDTESGLFLGIMENSDYDQKTIQVEKGDVLLMYTDGLIEIKKDGEEFGLEALKYFLQQNAFLDGKEFCDLLYTHITKKYKKNQKDDISLLHIAF